MSVYDPTCGSGGMLIISREFIEQSSGDPTNLTGQLPDPNKPSARKGKSLFINADAEFRAGREHPGGQGCGMVPG